MAFFLQPRQPPATSTNEPVISACKNPNCVRCRRYRQVQEKARARVGWIVRSFVSAQKGNDNDDPLRQARIQLAVQSSRAGGSGGAEANPWQAPTVLMVDNLPSKEVVTYLHLASCQYLRHRPTKRIVMNAIRSIATSSLPDDSDFWTINDSPRGRWAVLQILNQGSWNPALLAFGHGIENGSIGTNVAVDQEKQERRLIQELLDLVQNIPRLCGSCLFGNVLVSKIYPGTDIEPHCGPTNVRHRLHFLLEYPVGNKRGDEQSLSLQVGHSTHLSWYKEGGDENADRNDDMLFVFDDSFVHSVTFPGKESGDIDDQSDDCYRIVLIVDLWHPDLTAAEKLLLQSLYPPTT